MFEPRTIKTELARLSKELDLKSSSSKLSDNEFNPVSHDKQSKLERNNNLTLIQLRHNHQWNEIKKPLKDSFFQLYHSSKDNNKQLLAFRRQYKAINRMVNRVLYLLSERQSVMFHNLIEMLLDSNNRSESIIFISQVLDLGHQFKLWEYDQIRFNNKTEGNIKVRPLFLASQKYLDAKNKALVYLPLIVKPLSVNMNFDNKGSGYLLKRHDSLILNNKWHKEDISAEFLNILNQTAFKIIDLSEYFNHEFNLNNLIKLEDKSCIEDAKNNWEKFLSNKQKAYKLLKNYSIYFTHKYDTRGRFYVQGYYFNYQGDSHSKACLVLAKQEVISNNILSIKH